MVHEVGIEQTETTFWMTEIKESSQICNGVWKNLDYVLALYRITADSADLTCSHTCAVFFIINKYDSYLLLPAVDKYCYHKK